MGVRSFRSGGRSAEFLDVIGTFLVEVWQQGQHSPNPCKFNECHLRLLHY